MKQSTAFLSFILLAWTFVSSTAAAEEPAAKKFDRNAALLYWVAFDQYDALVRDEAVASAINEWATVTIDAKLRAALKDSPSLSLLRLASTIEHCDWGTGFMLSEQGPLALMPHLGRTRQLARLGMLSARIHLADKQFDEAVNDVMAVHVLARHSQAGDILISMLVGISIESMASSFITDNLDAIEDASLRTWRDHHAKLPAMMHVKDALIGERDGFGGWVKREIVKLKDITVRQRLAALLTGDEQGHLKRQLIGKSPDQAIAMADEMLKMYEPVLKIMEMPTDQYKKPYAEWEKQVKESKNPLIALMMPAFDSAYQAYHRGLANIALTRAAVTLKADGDAAFKAIKDPYGDGPFTMKIVDDGTEFSTKLEGRDGKKLTVKVKWKPSK